MYAKLQVPDSPPPPLDVGELFDAHGGFVHRVAQRLVGSATLADDVAQEVFLLAFRRRHEVLAQTGIRTWLYRATLNVARQGFRTDRRYTEALTRLARVPNANSVDPERILDRAQNGRLIRACIARLPEIHREVFVLFELEDLDGTDIASILEIPINTVWSRLRLARAAFRQEWTQLSEHTP